MSNKIMINESLLGFFNHVFSCEDLIGWRTCAWGSEETGTTDGTCFEEGKEIIISIYKEDKNTKALFLHEVAHAIYSMYSIHRYGHDVVFYGIQKYLAYKFFDNDADAEERLKWMELLALYEIDMTIFLYSVYVDKISRHRRFLFG